MTTPIAHTLADLTPTAWHVVAVRRRGQWLMDRWDYTVDPDALLAARDAGRVIVMHRHANGAAVEMWAALWPVRVVVRKRRGRVV